ncbi:unnamed protein product [Callosobruchus maculatus]|uniref:Uncharacterized protein n=1 Tax=Callosobruchus maculatus TaxID=64391 RepID=A0A653CWM4_CALMS|nr:unnamed protein product [Callosobruchus maculatus]
MWVPRKSTFLENTDPEPNYAHLLKNIWPESSFNRPLRAFSSVVLPQPLGPITASTCPGRTKPSTSCRTCLPPTLTVMPLNARWTGNGRWSVIRHGKWTVADVSTLEQTKSGLVIS